MRRGFLFSFDAILAFVLVMFLIGSVASVMESESRIYSAYMRSQSQYVAEDTLTVLRTTPLRDLVPPNVLEEWIASGILNTTLVTPEMPPLDIVATYWATEPIYPSQNLRHKAEVILGYLLNQTLKGYDYELLINNYTSPYLRKFGGSYSKAKDVSSATIIMSGYAYNQTPRGYMARAYLTKATMVREDLFGWSRVLAGSFSSSGEKNYLNVTSTIYIPAKNKSSIYEANGNFIKRFTEQEDVYINGNKVTLRSTEPNAPDIKDYLKPGINYITMYFHDSAYYGRYYRYTMGIGSGTTVYAKYLSTSFEVEDPGLVKVYNVTSGYTGFIYLIEHFIPGNISKINMRFKVEGAQVVRLYYGLGQDLYLIGEKTVSPTAGPQVVEFTDSEIKSALSDLGVSYENLSKMVFDFVVAVDAKYYTSDGQFHYGGANEVSYSCPASDCGGERKRTLYGYPDSYVKIEYIPRIAVTRYSVPLSVYINYTDPSYYKYTGEHCGAKTYKEMEVKYTLPSTAKPWYVDLWVGYCFDSSTTQELEENGKIFYKGPNGVYALRIAYTKLYSWMMKNGTTNVFRAILVKGVDDGGTSFRMGATRGIVKYFIEGYAGYRDVFPYLLQGYPAYKGYNLTYYYDDGNGVVERTILVGDEPYKPMIVDKLNPEKYAVDDAILRLFNKLNYVDDKNPGEWRESPFDGSKDNPIDVYLHPSIVMDFASMGNIPGLFKPIQITLRVWREG